MFTYPLFRLARIIALGIRHMTKFLLTASVLASLAMAGLPSANPFTYTVNGYTVVRPSELGPLTGTIDNSLQPQGPRHDFGAIGNASNLDLCLPTTVSPIFYTTFNGNIVVRPSELGPLTGTIDNSFQVRGPGHDFSAINGTSDLGLSLANTSLCTFTVSDK